MFNQVEMERNVIQKINAAEEIQICMKSYAAEDKQEINRSLKAALKSFERKESKTQDKGTPSLSKRVKVSNDDSSEHKQASKPSPQHQSQPKETQLVNHSAEQIQPTKSPHHPGLSEQSVVSDGLTTPEEKVVLRGKKVKETDDERRQRLSVHKEEIMKGNVKAAMEIFENLRIREELKGILSQVQEIESETSDAEVGSLKTLYDSVPACMETPSRNTLRRKIEVKKVDVEPQDDDLESISSVETAFEDLEKASKDIMNLKDQTLAKLLDIEETIKKALYSVSNLKSESDIAGLSGLFDESLKSEPNFQPANNIRKISIVSSKAKSGKNKEASDVQTDSSKPDVPKQVCSKPLIRQSSQSSPSFISIHSAARKPVEQPKSTMSTFKPTADGFSHTSPDERKDPGQGSVTAESSKSPPRRKVSVLEVQTVPEQPAGIIGRKTVSETYEETDGFGNVFVSSVTSTVVTKQSDNKPAALFEVVGSPARYEVMTSPVIKRSGGVFEEKASSSTKEEGKVFVTFSQAKEKL